MTMPTRKKTDKLTKPVNVRDIHPTTLKALNMRADARHNAIMDRLSLIESGISVLQSGATFMQELDKNARQLQDMKEIGEKWDAEEQGLQPMEYREARAIVGQAISIANKHKDLYCDKPFEERVGLLSIDMALGHFVEPEAAPQPIGLSPGDYTDASKETADALTAMGCKWVDGKLDKDWTHIKFYHDGKFQAIQKILCEGTYYDPATFLARAAVTAKEIGLVPVEEKPWAPEVGCYVASTRNYFAGISKVVRLRYVNDRSSPPCAELENGRCDYWDRLIPATEDEIAAHLAEQEARKPVVFGTRVEYEDDKGWKIAMDVPSPDGTWMIVKQGHARIAWVKRSGFTVID